MYPVSLIDWLMTTALIAASWQLYRVVLPPLPADAAAGPKAGQPADASTAGPLDATLERIRAAGGFTTLEAFMTGAKLAYEAVIVSFAAGDMVPITGWLGPAVRKALEDAIKARMDRQETLSTMFIGFVAAEPIAAGLDDDAAWIDVRFVAQLVSVTKDRDGAVVAGHPRRVEDIAEVWTFSREPHSADPNWMLVATEAAEA